MRRKRQQLAEEESIAILNFCCKITNFILKNDNSIQKKHIIGYLFCDIGDSPLNLSVGINQHSLLFRA